MDIVKGVTLVLAASLAFSPALSAAEAPSNTWLYVPPSEFEQIRYSYQQNLENLRERAIATKTANGGILTHEKRTKFQRELDEINRTLQRRLRNANFFSVDAFGHTVN